MTDSTYNIFAKLAKELRRNGQSFAGPGPTDIVSESKHAAGGGQSTLTTMAQLAGNALGIDKRCGSVLGLTTKSRSS